MDPNVTIGMRVGNVVIPGGENGGGKLHERLHQIEVDGGEKQRSGWSFQ